MYLLMSLDPFLEDRLPPRAEGAMPGRALSTAPEPQMVASHGRWTSQPNVQFIPKEPGMYRITYEPESGALIIGEPNAGYARD